MIAGGEEIGIEITRRRAPGRRESQKRRRRENILATARELFFARGFRGTTIDDIARESRMARGTIYLYFENKEAIYATVMEEGLDILRRMIAESQRVDVDPLTNLLAGHDAFLRFHTDERPYYSVLMLNTMEVMHLLPAELRDRLSRKLAEIGDDMCLVLRAGMEQGVFRAFDTRETAYLHMGLAMGFAMILDKCEGGPLFTDPDRARELMHDMIANSVIARAR